MVYVEKGVNLCMLPGGLVCMGCCGFDFSPKLSPEMKEEFVKALLQSTEEFAQAGSKQEFRTRYASYDLHDCGMCRQLILDTDATVDELMDRKTLPIYCPLHPAQNEGRDLREDECDTRYMCKTQQKFLQEWDESTRERFLQFVAERDLDWFSYSVQIYTGSLLQEFEGAGKDE